VVLLRCGGGKVDQQIIQALIALGVIVIGGLGTLVKVLVDKLSDELKRNTTITTQARDASNGRLSEVLNLLESERNQRINLETQLRDREDKLSYIFAKHPDVAPSMSNFRDRRSK